jgi:hypothetical protein
MRPGGHPNLSVISDLRSAARASMAEPLLSARDQAAGELTAVLAKFARMQRRVG